MVYFPVHRREHVVREVLSRQCSLLRSEENAAKEQFLIHRLNVPVTWIHEAKVCRSLLSMMDTPFVVPTWDLE